MHSDTEIDNDDADDADDDDAHLMKLYEYAMVAILVSKVCGGKTIVRPKM